MLTQQFQPSPPPAPLSTKVIMTMEIPPGDSNAIQTLTTLSRVLAQIRETQLEGPLFRSPGRITPPRLPPPVTSFLPMSSNVLAPPVVDTGISDWGIDPNSLFGPPIAAVTMPVVDWDSLLDASKPTESANGLTKLFTTTELASIADAAKQFVSADQLPIIAAMEDPYRTQLRDEVLQLVLKSLTSPSGSPLPNAASMMAELVRLELVLVKGVVNTLDKLLTVKGTRAAAISVIGKLCEQAAGGNKSIAQSLAPLRPQIVNSSDPSLEYDTCYISKTLGWQTPAATLIPIRSMPTPHQTPILATAYINNRDEVVTASNDRLCFWGSGDTPIAEFSVPPNTIPCTVDASPKGTMVVTGCAPTGRGPMKSLIQVHICNLEGNWSTGQVNTVQNASIITAVKCISSRVSVFAASYSTVKGGHAIGLFNANGNPVKQMTEAHSDFITCLAGSTDNENWLLSGSKDKTVKVWDTRSHTPSHHLNHHTDTVTCVAAVRDVVLTGSLDKSMCLWDTRKLKVPIREKKFSNPVLKVVCVAPQAMALVSTTTSLSVLALHPLEVQDIIPNVIYTDLKPNADGTVFFASGPSAFLDVFALQQ